MVERFIINNGTITVASGASGASVVTGTGTTFASFDNGGAQIWAHPAGIAPVRIGSIADLSLGETYDNLELPLVSPYHGPTYTDVDYELVDGLALVQGASEIAVYARFTAYLAQSMGLVGNTADAVDFSLVQENTLFVDAVTRTIYQWRGGVLEPVSVVGGSFTPRGAHSTIVTYAKNDLVQSGTFAFVSNVEGNLNHVPVTSPSPASNSFWTWLPLPAGSDAFALNISIGGRPAAGEFVPGHVFADTVTFPAGASSIRARARVAAEVQRVFSLYRNGVAVATVTFPAGNVVGAGNLPALVTFAPGDWQDTTCPTTRDATLEDIRITWRGSR